MKAITYKEFGFGCRMVKDGPLVSWKSVGKQKDFYQLYQ